MENDYKVADMSLAEFGRREISLAENEMPALMALRTKYKDAQPLAGAKVMGCIHMTIQTCAYRDVGRSWCRSALVWLQYSPRKIMLLQLLQLQVFLFLLRKAKLMKNLTGVIEQTIVKDGGLMGCEHEFR